MVEFVQLFVVSAFLLLAIAAALDDTYGTGVSWSDRLAATFCGAALAAMWGAAFLRWWNLQ